MKIMKIMLRTRTEMMRGKIMEEDNLTAGWLTGWMAFSLLTAWLAGWLTLSLTLSPKYQKPIKPKPLV